MEGPPKETPNIKNDLPRISEEHLKLSVQESQEIGSRPISEHEKLLEDHETDRGLPESKKNNNQTLEHSDVPKNQGPVEESSLIVKPTNWRPQKGPLVSKRWREKFEKLVNDSEVSSVGNLMYKPTEDFLIAKERCCDVYLGLKHDGIEVAIKKFPKCKYQLPQYEEEILRYPKLDYAPILRYVDAAVDDMFVYLAVQLHEYSLEEFIKHNKTNIDRAKIVEDILKGLMMLHNNYPPILHGDITERNIVIDVTGQAKIANFSNSMCLVEKEKPWNTAKETPVDENEKKNKLGFDILMVGKLFFYVSSGGRHLSADNLHHVKDVLERDLIERMTNKDTQKKIEECLQHPFFWTHQRKEEYIRRFANKIDTKTEKGKGKKKEPDPEFVSLVEKHDESGSLKNWKTKFPEELKKMESWRQYNNDVFGLLRFFRNLCEHHVDKEVNVTAVFPDLFGCIYKFAESKEWNLEPPLKDVFLFTKNVY